MTYIHEETEVCQQVIKNIDKNLNTFKQLIAAKQPKNWLVLATGSSANAMLSAKYYIEKTAGVSIEIQEPFNFVHYEKQRESTDFVLAVSQSGHSYSTIEALKKVHKNNDLPTAVLTSGMDSPIVDFTNMVIDIGCGIEKVGFVTKGFTATVLTAMLIGIIAGETSGCLGKEVAEREMKQLKKLTENIPSIIKKTEHFYAKHAKELNAIPRYCAIGYGPTVGTALEFETKFTETVRVPSQGFELEAYMHGPYLEVNDSHGLFFIQTNSTLAKRSDRLQQYFHSYTEHCFTITNSSHQSNEKTLALCIEVDELMSPLIMAIPFQILSYRIATGKGINLGVRIFDDFDQVLKSKI
ncbi:SIS domain-containing protein [Bacillus changyiensis]|uniref:SIS domain-containing protein n=1 Tax=Bacillus changyiensis TaxID=3004103 RepID=UPI0022E0326C|nr:SIS domain-containing protein [Bacillus changyiensis]MDA1477864.1 SIS domain-containing protein [Bacillus changyiensis]